MIEYLQKEMLKQSQVDIKTVHRFSDGVYSREITIPKGHLIVGAKHKTEHFYVISSGQCAVYNQGEKDIFAAPYTGITKPGAKRAIYAIEDTVFTTFHPTNETDIDKIEKAIIEPEGFRIQNSGGVHVLDNH